MITTIISLLILFFLVGVLVFAIRGRVPRIANLGDVVARVRPVNVAAFRNLASDETSTFLKRRVPVGLAPGLERERWRIASAYVRVIAANAAVLVQAGQLASRSQDPVLAQRGAELAKIALSVRVNALRLLVRVYVYSVLPSLANNVAAEIPDQYLHLRTLIEGVYSIEQPTLAGELRARL